MKPYLLIAGDRYYPERETNDWKGCFETEEEAKDEFKRLSSNRSFDWHIIVDLREWME